MIRITAQHELSGTRLFLEGKLCGRCVDELDKCWRESSAGESPLLVDLTNISFVDEHGIELLARMHKQGIKLFSTSLMTKCLIDQIEKTHAVTADEISSPDERSSPDLTTTSIKLLRKGNGRTIAVVSEPECFS